MRQDGGTVHEEGGVRAGVLSGEPAVSVTVVFEDNCTFDIGLRTPERRAQARLHIKTIVEYLGRHWGLPPEAVPAEDTPGGWVLTDGRWQVGYDIVRQGGSTTIRIRNVRLL